MQCREINELIMKYFDHDISELEMEILEKHNEKCPSCALEFNALKDALSALEELPELEAPEGFEARVMENIKMQHAALDNKQSLVFWLIGILGLIIFACNMLSFVIIPYIRDSGILIIAQNVIIFAVTGILSLLREALITLSVLVGKLLIFRNVLLRDYMDVVMIVVFAFVGMNLLLISKLKLQEGWEGLKNEF